MTDTDHTTFIQWKGTVVCMGWDCKCGVHHHVDGDFCYVLQCADCGRIYMVGTEVTLTEVPAVSMSGYACRSDGKQWPISCSGSMFDAEGNPNEPA